MAIAAQSKKTPAAATVEVLAIHLPRLSLALLMTSPFVRFQVRLRYPSADGAVRGLSAC
jgi:hypothetical protein